MLGKLTVPGRPTYLDNGTCRARAYCACSDSGGGRGVEGGGLDIFSHLSFLFRETPDIDLLSQGTVKPRTTNQLK